MADEVQPDLHEANRAAHEVARAALKVRHLGGEHFQELNAAVDKYEKIVWRIGEGE
jgi:hypothetical protein